MLIWIENPELVAGELKYVVDASTHMSGTAVDIVSGPTSLDIRLQWVPAAEVGCRSDHYCGFVEIPGEIEAKVTECLGNARWLSSGDWGDALRVVRRSLQFIGGWTGVAMQNSTLTAWTGAGAKRGVRQAILDRAVWWRAVVVTLCGHYGGMVFASGPQPRDRNRHEESLQTWRDLVCGGAVGDQ